MINYTTIATEFNKLVGFRSNVNVSVHTDYTTSTSGIYIDDIIGMQPNVLQLIYDSIYVNSSTDIPDIDTYLSNLMNSQIRETMRMYVIGQKKLSDSRAILEKIEFPKRVDKEQTISKSDRFVGIKFEFKKVGQVAVQINRVGLQFDALQTNLPVYLFVDSKDESIKNTPITTTSKLQFTDLTDWVMHYVSEYGEHQQYYLMYKEEDVNGNAIALDADYDCFKNVSSFVDIEGVYFNNSDLSGNNLPDTDKENLNSEAFGFHVRATTQCDITSFLVDNKNTFSGLLSKRIAIKILFDLMNSTRFDVNTVVSKNYITENIGKIEYEYKEELDRINMDYSSLDKYCLPRDKFKLGTTTSR